MYDEQGKLIWETELDIYGKVRTFAGRSLSEYPFRYQGQYEDVETGLYYNRLRYYSPDEGMYISQDPIRLAGNNPKLYGYVKDVNSWVDKFGLAGQVSFIGDALHPATIKPNNPEGTYKIEATGSYHGDKKALYGAAGITDSFSPDYVAHHVSYDASTNEMTMQLVKAENHKVSHEGGVKQYEEITGKKYKTTCKP